MQPIRLAVLAAVLGSGILAAQSKVWVVAPAPGPGVDFTQVQAAVLAATSGDTILVRTGTYGPVDIDAKALVITADAGTDPVIVNSPTGIPVDVFRVRNLSADQAVVLAGLTLDSSVYYASNESPFEVTSCAGPVRVERCRLVGGSPNPLQNEIPGDDAAVVILSTVVFVESDLLAGDGMDGSWNFATDGGVGLRATSASVVLEGCVVAGGAGGDIDPTAGGAGCRAVASSVHVAGSELRGGENKGKPGGTGLWLGSGSTAALLDSTVFPEVGFPPGVDFLVDASSALAGLHGELHTLQLDSPLREGQVGSARFGGDAGELVFLVAGSGPAQIPIWGITGPLLVGGPLTVLALGVLPPSGLLALPFTVQELGPSVQGVTVHAQGAFLAPTQVFLGEAAALVLLDASF